MNERFTPVELLVGPVLRHVGHHHATLWVEVSDACAVSLWLDGIDEPFVAHTFVVNSHHYALVIAEGLPAAAIMAYRVTLDDHLVWPLENSAFPSSVIRTLGGDGPVRVLAGSCRAAAPHEVPWTLEATADPVGRGIDALRAHGLRMLGQSPASWPHLLIFLGDQVYADDAPPVTAKRISVQRWRERRNRRGPTPPQHHAPDETIVDGFEEYTWLYHEAWTPDVERWVLSTVPSAMIFDDHDMIDDWNISDSWVREIRATPWWRNHVIGGLTSYWVYQHLGNLSPEEIRSEGMLERLLKEPDGEGLLRAWAEESEQFTPTPGGYRFSYARDLDDVRLVVADCRNGRVLEPGARAMLDTDEWEWITHHATQECKHLVIASSLPVFVPGGLHGLQAWNEAIVGGRWGKSASWLSERLRRALDLEDWAAFARSFTDMVTLLHDVASGTGRAADNTPPATLTLLSGDIHFSYRAAVEFPDQPPCRVNQIVSSPIRNALAVRDRRVLRFGLSRVGRRIGTFLQRVGGVADTTCRWELTEGPYFHNSMVELIFDEDRCVARIERAAPDDDGAPVLLSVISMEL
jgi:hypothetical protein